jgi:polysaccharide deacetylase 2 family uncharacterized protein YibQ
MSKPWPWLLLCVGGLCGLFTPVAATAEARLAIIIDDIGYNKTQSERAANLKGKFTLAILPFTPHGLNSANIAHHQGKELMLHLPMSTVNNMPIGKGGLISGMKKDDFLRILRQDIDALPLAQGVNNHMGSRLTQETEPMQWLMAELHQRGLYFVDSRTSAQTRALDIARQFQVPSVKRDVFLDDLNETKAIQYQLNRAIQFARQRGSAVAIGHPYPLTLAVLEQIQPLLAAEGVTLVYVSQLLTTFTEMPALEPANSPTHFTKASFCPAPLPNFLTKLGSGIDLYDSRTMLSSEYFGY